MAKVNGVEPSKINGITLPTALLTGSWTARPGTGDDSEDFDDPSHGDWYRVSSSADGLLASYRYSSIVEEWVRPEIYEGTPAVITQIRGSVLPSAEDAAWTHTTANGGAITTDGTKVTFNGGSSTNKTAYAIYDHDEDHDEFHFMQGLVQCTATSAPGGSKNGRVIGIDANSKFYKVVLDTNDITASFANNTTYTYYGKDHNNWPYQKAGTNLPSGSALADATTNEVFMEFYANASGSWCYLSHSTTPTMIVEGAGGGMQSTSNKNYTIGDLDGSEIGTITIRESFWGTYTPTANTASALYIYGGA
tara:strand:+ start:607 stop:1524 length:918 start_codon:yes stop_codon:yes gene_type:complete